MSLIKKYKVGDRVVLTDGEGVGNVGDLGTVSQVNWIAKKRFWWYGVTLDNPPKGKASSYMFRDYMIRKA